MVERIAQKHVGLNILPEHYPAVAEALLGAIKDVLGDAATDDIMTAWGEAYWLLADVLIAREAGLYRELAAAPGGWNGWRDFILQSTDPESEIIRSFVLVPADGGPVLRHRAGQYLTFALEIAGAGLVKRNYSISCAPNQRSYRISIKREARPGVPLGIASNWFHDHAGPGTRLRVAPPAGEFFLEEESDRPVVLLSGGVGLTPMMSMLEQIAGGERATDLVREAPCRHPVARRSGAGARQPAGGAGSRRHIAAQRRALVTPRSAGPSTSERAPHGLPTEGRRAQASSSSAGPKNS